VAKWVKLKMLLFGSANAVSGGVNLLAGGVHPA
jgi:hypothetical protein